MNHPPPYASTWELILIFLKQRRRLRVTGDSMAPTLQAGDVVLINEQAYRDSTSTIGDIVVANHPTLPNQLIVKRVQSITEDGRCFLVGDNPSPLESTDSRTYGAVDSALIIGKVTSRLNVDR